MSEPSLIDRSVKVLIRRNPPVFFRLAGLKVDPSLIRAEDVSVNLPEYRADQVFIMGERGVPGTWAAHLEYQLEPDPERLLGWFLKNAGLTAQLKMPVILIGVYLEKGDRATFPSAYAAKGGGRTNRFSFPTLRLWEHAERIRSGELRELAPLLVLCEDKPTEATLRTERELILASPLPQPDRAELLSLAVTVASRRFPREKLFDFFKEDLPMLKDAPIIGDWIAEGEARGEARGRVEEARELLLIQLRMKFGELPAETVRRVGAADLEWCRNRALRLLDARSLEEMDL